MVDSSGLRIGTHLNSEIIYNTGFPPNDGSVASLRGLTAMIRKAALPALQDSEYDKEEKLFGFWEGSSE